MLDDYEKTMLLRVPCDGWTQEDLEIASEEGYEIFAHAGRWYTTIEVYEEEYDY